jgi:hypothetical protein
VPGVRVHGRDDPVLRDPPRDPKDPVLALVQVLACDRRQQLGRPLGLLAQLSSVERDQQRPRVLRQRVDQRLARRAILVVAHRLARRPILIIAAQKPAQLRLQLRIADGQQAADRRAHERDGVHRRDRVIQGRRIQHPPTTDQPSLPGGLEHHLEDPIRTLRARQPGAHVDQHRMHEPRIVEPQPARRVLPAQIEAEPLDRLTIRAPLQPLQHHHHRHDHRRHTVAPRIAEEVREHLIREQTVALAVQQPVDRVRRDQRLAEARGRGEHVLLAGR